MRRGDTSLQATADVNMATQVPGSLPVYNLGCLLEADALLHL